MAVSYLLNPEACIVHLTKVIHEARAVNAHLINTLSETRNETRWTEDEKLPLIIDYSLSHVEEGKETVRYLTALYDRTLGRLNHLRALNPCTSSQITRYLDANHRLASVTREIVSTLRDYVQVIARLELRGNQATSVLKTVVRPTDHMRLPLVVCEPLVKHHAPRIQAKHHLPPTAALLHLAQRRTRAVPKPRSRPRKSTSFNGPYASVLNKLNFSN